MTKKAKPARKHKSAVLGSLLQDINPLDKAKVEQKMILAARIADLMEEKGYGKKQFAEKLGKSPSEITKWLSGVHNFTTDTLTEIAFWLEVTVQELYAPRQVEVIYKLHAQVTRKAAPRPSYMNQSCDFFKSLTEYHPAEPKNVWVAGNRAHIIN